MKVRTHTCLGRLGSHRPAGQAGQRRRVLGAGGHLGRAGHRRPGTRRTQRHDHPAALHPPHRTGRAAPPAMVRGTGHQPADHAGQPGRPAPRDRTLGRLARPPQPEPAQPGIQLGRPEPGPRRLAGPTAGQGCAGCRGRAGRAGTRLRRHDRVQPRPPPGRRGVGGARLLPEVVAAVGDRADVLLDPSKPAPNSTGDSRAG